MTISSINPTTAVFSSEDLIEREISAAGYGSTVGQSVSGGLTIDRYA